LHLRLEQNVVKPTPARAGLPKQEMNAIGRRGKWRCRHLQALPLAYTAQLSLAGINFILRDFEQITVSGTMQTERNVGFILHIFADDEGAIVLKADIAQLQITDFSDFYAAIKDHDTGSTGLVKLKLRSIVHVFAECNR
jgi:hypothetical protein